MAESRGKSEDGLLKDAYAYSYAHGDMHNKADFFRRALTSKQLKLKKKEANIAGLQLADLLAYPVKQQILQENDRVEEAAQTFGNTLAQAIEDKYDHHAHSARVGGHCRVLFPK